MINFEGVTKQYPDGTVAVDDLTLEVPDGTLTVFVGPSGCGKTTSMRMINRMIEPTSGTLTVNDDDVTKVDPVKLRLGIGYVIQSAGLMPHQRVIDNVATVPVLRGESRRTARKAALGPGGVLEQYDDPFRLLSNPAGDFVAGFIGADRGYRGLQWRHSTGLPLHDIRCVAEADIDGLALGPNDWVLITKSDGAPFGWVNAGGVELHRTGSSLYDSTYGGGSLVRSDDSI